MIKIPTYIDCISKIVIFLGLDYSEEENKTEKFKLNEQKTFANQSEIYTKKYEPKILDLFAGKDEQKRKLVSTFLTMSESFIRHFNGKEHCSLATKEQAMWGLLVSCYIPAIAWFVSVYKKRFGIPQELIDNNFMFPSLENGTVITPTAKLKSLLNPIAAEIPTESKTVTFLSKLEDNTVPRYQTYVQVLNDIKKNFKSADLDKNISVLFRMAIVSGGIYQDLLNLFEDKSVVLNLFEHFSLCLKTSDDIINGKKPENEDIWGFINIYNIDLQHEHEANRLLERDDLDANERKEFLIRRCELRNVISSAYSLFLMNSENNGKTAYSLQAFFTRPAKIPHESILRLMDTVNALIFRSETIPSNQVSSILEQIEKKEFFDLYKHRYYFCKAHCYLGKNDFENALELFKETAKQCANINAAPIQFKSAKKVITLEILINNKIFSRLNQYLKMIQDVEPNEFNGIRQDLIGIPSGYKERNDYLYLGKVLKIISEFNSQGYARYEGTECVKINPFEKVEQFVKDFYALYDANENTESKVKVKEVIKNLTSNRGAKYKLDSNLVVLDSFKPLDVFEPSSFAHIYQFCLDSKLECENISKLRKDFETLNHIFLTLRTLCALLEPKSIPYMMYS